MDKKNIFIIAFFFTFFLIFMYILLFSNDFTFLTSKLVIDGNFVKESLEYNPDKDYHTLYRNFDSPLYDSVIVGRESILIKNVSCSNGEPYARAYGICLDFNLEYYRNVCLPYTEDHEYGCTFGDFLGFKKGNEERVGAEYYIEPPQLFEYNGEHYYKFIVYKEKRHPYLVLNKNFFVEGGIAEKRYFPFEKVIVYVPYEPSNINKYKITSLKKLDYDKVPIYLYLIAIIISILITSIIFFIYKRKISDLGVPKELSNYPLKRKPWEVASIFDFNSSNVIPSTILDFYKRKIIDIKTEKSNVWFWSTYNTYVKILKNPNDLDEIEKIVYKLLKTIEKNSSKINGYFDLKPNFMTSLKLSSDLRAIGRILDKTLKESRKKYGHLNYIFIVTVSLIAIILGIFFIFYFDFYFLFFLIFFILAILLGNYKMFYKFRSRDLQKEYYEWQAFKKYLKVSYSMRASEVKGIILWNEYLVYATALGVSKKILKRLKKDGLITDEQYNSYNHTFIAFSSVSASSGFSGGTGGGAGGGGAGGGGGGGR